MDIQTLETSSNENRSIPVEGEEGQKLLALYQTMVQAQALETALGQKVAAKEIAPLPHSDGLLTAIVGMAGAMKKGDWLFPAAQDVAAALFRGMPLSAYLDQVFANGADRLKGRQLPGAFSGKSWQVASVGAPAANHLPHAVGFAWAAHQRQEALVTLASFDAAEIDAQDFHTGVNFAGVMNTATVFLCRVCPGEESAAAHAIAYGVTPRTVDGNDLEAVLSVVGEAIEQARRGDGPSLVDLCIGKDDSIGEDDGVASTYARLIELGLWDESQESAYRAELDSQVSEAIELAQKRGRSTLDTHFDDVFAGQTSHLDDQRAQSARSPRFPKKGA